MTDQMIRESPASRPDDPVASLLVIIPAFNEEGCIREVVRRARQALLGADVLVIDDGSTDQTAHEAREGGAQVISHPFNLGIGGAVQTGLKFARRMGFEFVLRIDGDGQHDPRELSQLLAMVQTGRADVAVGSRFLQDGMDLKIPLFRRLGIHLFAGEVSLLTGYRATDTTSGMTAMNHWAVDLLATYMPQDYPEVESRIILHGAGLTTEEVPVQMSERLAGVSSINSWRSVYYALKVSVAVLLTAMKEPPKTVKSPKEVADAQRTVAYGDRPQLGPIGDHHPASSQTQIA